MHKLIFSIAQSFDLTFQSPRQISIAQDHQVQVIIVSKLKCKQTQYLVKKILKKIFFCEIDFM